MTRHAINEAIAHLEALEIYLNEDGRIECNDTHFLNCVALCLIETFGSVCTSLYRNEKLSDELLNELSAIAKSRFVDFVIIEDERAGLSEEMKNDN